MRMLVPSNPSDNVRGSTRSPNAYAALPHHSLYAQPAGPMRVNREIEAMQPLLRGFAFKVVSYAKHGGFIEMLR